MRSRSSSVVCSIVPTCATPALLTSTSSGPNISSAAANARITSCWRETSHANASAAPPAERIACRVSSAGETSMMQTRAPRAANSRAIACPIPEPPPVTIAVRPASVGAAASAMNGNLEIVESRRVLAEERAPLRHGPGGGELVDDRAPALRATAQYRHRPVRSVDQPRRAEAQSRLVDVRTQRRRLALIGSRLGEQSGELAHDSVVEGEHGKALGPPLECIVSDRGLPAVIEHEARLRAPLDERNRFRKLLGGDAQLEGKTVRRDVLHPAHERGLERVAGALMLDVVSYAHDVRRSADVCEGPVARGLVEQVDERDDPDDARLLVGQRLDPLHLAQTLARGAIRLDEDDRVDRPLLQRREVFRAERPLQCGGLGEPWIVQAGRIPEVHVRVHHRRAGHDQASAASAAAAVRSAQVARNRSSATARTMITPMMISWM